MDALLRRYPAHTVASLMEVWRLETAASPTLVQTFSVHPLIFISCLLCWECVTHLGDQLPHGIPFRFLLTPMCLTWLNTQAEREVSVAAEVLLNLPSLNPDLLWEGCSGTALFSCVLSTVFVVCREVGGGGLTCDEGDRQI